jgi:TetR/AcrR family transcriptional regulator, transcriptional repressor for nem operon
MPDPTRHRASRTDAATTSTQILDVAERLAQTRGFNGFSYADIAAELGITKASLHYHFATKADLGRALIERYSTAFAKALSQIEASGAEARAQLKRYVQLYADVLSDGRICLCGMFAAEYTTLPDPMQQAIRRFFDDNEAWLTRVLEAGRRAKTLAFDGGASNAARMLTGALEGAMLLARSYGDATRFAAAAAHLLREFAPALDERQEGASPSRPAARRRRSAVGRRA